LEIDNVVVYFDGIYTEWEINNALKTIIDKSDASMYYRDYVNIYSSSNVKKIMVGISNLFSSHFRISFDNIAERFPTYTTFEVLTALKNMIDESIVIKNKYGFSSYLREDENIYFLVNSLSISNDSFSGYYARVPNIVTDKTFREILYDVQIENLPKFVKILCEIKKPDTFAKLIRTVPEEVQELFIEAAIEAHIKNILSNQITRKLVLDYFLNYIHQIKDVWVSNKLSDDDILRCYENGNWGDCDNEYGDLVEEKIETRKGTLEQNPWGYYGQHNPETGVFSMVNVVKQRAEQEKEKEKQRKKLTVLVKKGKKTQEEMDKELDGFIAGRQIYPGKNCRSWSVTALAKIGIKIIKLDYPDSFKKTESQLRLRKLAKDDRYLGKGSKKEKPLYTSKEIDELSSDDLRRGLYWTTRKQGGYVTTFCVAIEQWFRKTKWEGLDMLIPDKQAGTTGGHIKISSKPKEKKQSLRIEKVVPEQNKDRFKTYLKDIQKLMNECFSVKKYVPEIDDKRWVMVFSRKKLVGFLAIDKKNIIWNVCVATNYRRRGIAKQAIQIAVNDVCPAKKPRLLVDNRGKNYKKLVKLYTGYGFTLVKNDGKVTTMEFKCT
jgi:hypothetical protein